MLGYRVENAPIFMIGSVHALPEAWAENIRAVLRTLLAPMSCLVVEADLDAPFDRSITCLPAGTSLHDVVEPDLFKQVMSIADSLEIAENEVVGAKPWWAALYLTFRRLERAGYVHAHSVDRIALNLAAEVPGRVELRPLESPDYGLRIFDRPPLQSQVGHLRLFMERHEQALSEFESLLRGWATADEDLIETVLDERLALAPEIFEPLVSERNRLWLPVIESILRENRPSLIVVGALHFVGKDGLPALLRSAGHSVEVLWGRSY